jgi:hypothetical protein
MKYLTLFLFAMIAIHASAQNKKQDILYLKSGGIIYGTVKDRTDKIKIQVSGGSTLIYRADEVDSIKQESMNKALRRDFFSTYYRKAIGYRNITEVQFTYGPRGSYNSESDDVGISVHSINGYQCTPQFFIGIGVGIDRLLTNRLTFIPIYVRFQSELLKNRITPYLFGDAGYAFWVADNGYDAANYRYHRIGGYYMTLGGGVHIYSKGPLSYMIGAGYRLNYNETKSKTGNNNDYTEKYTYQRLVVSWALTF